MELGLGSNGSTILDLKVATIDEDDASDDDEGIVNENTSILGLG